MTYIVYAEWYGSKKKIKVVGGSAVNARKVVADSVKIHKIVKEEPVTSDDLLKTFKDMFGMFDK